MRIFAHSTMVRVLAAILMAAFSVTPARAAFHLWSIQEVYSDASGSLQFIELIDTFGGNNFVGGTSITVFNVGNSLSQTYTLPGNTLGGSTFGHTLLFGTSGLQAAGGPAPDYTIPNGFLFSAGGSISFFGLNSGTYSALPTDGSLSRTWSGGNAVNTPQNYSGQTGRVSVPEPAVGALLVASLALVRSGRRAARARG